MIAMTTSVTHAMLVDIATNFEKQRTAAERAMEQLDDAAFFVALGEGDNSVAVIAKHMAGNLRSRFTDFLTSDGEKPDRNRDGEFEVGAAESRGDVMAQWNRGWGILRDSLHALVPEDLLRTIHIRDEAMTVLQALLRALTHQSHHAGQILLLAKHLAGSEWQTLSIPKRQKR
jgi:uncharacterized damage-inducible protein DinB